MFNRQAALSALAVLAFGAASLYDTPATHRMLAQTTPGGAIHPGSHRNRRAKGLTSVARRRQARSRKCHPRRNKRK